ncbi:unknown [Prevotella sp. CAG:487]|nr:unknown [Prevotella sp. CAG:487]
MYCYGLLGRRKECTFWQQIIAGMYCYGLLVRRKECIY